MIILFDIGNTRTKYCTVDHDILGKQNSICNAEFSQDYLTESFKEVDKIIVASVGHCEVANQIDSWCKNNRVECRCVITEIKKNNVVNVYKDPTKLGVDRWLALVGASELYPNQNLLIIDSGTATTVDLLASSGQHQGGWILAGINTQVSSVLAGTSLVTANKEEKESVAFATNTSSAVHNGAWASTIGAVNLAICQAQQNGHIVDKVIFTGGNGSILSSLINYPNVLIEELVFNGLQAYIE